MTLNAGRQDVSALYLRGYGLKRIAKEVGLSPSGVKKQLQKAHVYLGKERLVVSGRTADPSDLDYWVCEGDCTRQKNGQGWILRLAARGAGVACPWLRDCYGRGVLFAVQVRLLWPMRASLLLGIDDGEGGMSTQEIRLDASHTAGRQVWVTRATCGSYPRPFIRSADEVPIDLCVGQVTVHVAPSA